MDVEDNPALLDNFLEMDLEDIPALPDDLLEPFWAMDPWPDLISLQLEDLSSDSDSNYDFEGFEP